MAKKYIYILFAILAFVSLCIKPTFCRTESKEEAKMEKQRKQIIEYAQKGENETATKLGEEYLKSDPTNIEILVTLADSYLTLGNFTKAEEAVKKALSVEATNGWAMKTLAKIYRAQAEQAKTPAEKKKLLNLAATEIEKVIKTNPDDAWASAEAALIYYYQEKKDEAAKAIKKAIAAQPNDKYFKEIKTKIETTP